MTRGELIRRHDDAVAKCALLMKHEEDTSRILLTAIHDLKNPISSIIGSCEYLSEYSRENLEPEQLEMIGGIEASARTLLQISGKLFQLCGASGQPTMDDAATMANDGLDADA
jgi:signal transduction histidine kinase